MTADYIANQIKSRLETEKVHWKQSFELGNIWPDVNSTAIAKSKRS